MSYFPPQLNTIADASRAAVANLTSLAKQSQGLAEAGDSTPRPFDFSEELARLRIWIREHRDIDFKLHESSDLRALVLSLLQQISKLPVLQELSSSIEVVSGDGRLSTGSADVLHKYLPATEDAVESNAPSLDTNITFSDSLSESPSMRAHDLVTRLCDLGPTLLNPAPLDSFEGTADGALYDIAHVRQKFSNADENLVVRLGRANWNRRQHLNDLRFGRASHHFMPILQTTERDPIDSASTDDDASDSESLPAEPQNYPGILRRHTSDDAPNVLTETSKPSNPPSSVRETQSTALTEPDKQASREEKLARNTNTSYKIPAPPPPNQHYTGRRMLCPFCAHDVSDISSRMLWKKHVCTDLKPYVCTYSNCMHSTRTFASRSEWWSHEIEQHRTDKAWICRPCERQGRNAEYWTADLFDQHVKEHHSKLSLSSDYLASIRELCETAMFRRPPRKSCPLCNMVLVNGRAPKRLLHKPAVDTSSLTTSVSATPHRKDELEGRTTEISERPLQNGENAEVNRDASQDTATERAVRKHVAHHLEQLAYFVAFPAGQLQEDESEFQDDSDSEADHRTEIKSIASKETHISKKEMHLLTVQAFLADKQRADVQTTGASIPGQSGHQDRATQPSQDLDGIGNASTARDVTPNFPIFLQVPPRNEHFYSRERLFANIDAALSSIGPICIIHGVGGVGKTLTAIEYCHSKRQQYDAIFWLQADTTPGLTASYSQMIQAVGLNDDAEDHDQIFAKGRDWLQHTDKRWLAVFDNAVQRHEVDILQCMPATMSSTSGSILITTQVDKLLPPMLKAKQLNVELLSQKAGAEMLLRYLDRDIRTDPEKQLAKDISAFVGGLPIAIAHVAGYISFSRYTLDELIDTFREWRKRTGVATDESDDLPGTFRQEAFSYDGALAMVWEITLRELSQDACDVLNVLAYFNCSAIPQEIVWRMHEDPILRFLDPRERIRMRRINDQLTKRRLLSVTDGHISMHRSLQRGIREKLSQEPGQQQTVFNQAVALLREAFPRSQELQQPDPGTSADCQKLLPHLHALHEVYTASKLQIKGSTEFATLLLDAGMEYFDNGVARDGLLLLHTAEQVLDSTSRPSSESYKALKANINTMIALMYDNIGIGKRQEALDRRREALDLRRSLFEGQQKVRRQDEILLFNAWMDYAVSLLHTYHYKDAEPIIEKCLAKYREWGSEEEYPFEYAKFNNNIAQVRMSQGKFDEAIHHASHGAQLMEKTGYKKFTSRFKFDLACIILQSGDVDHALKVHTEILDSRLQTVGAENPLTLHSMYAIGAIKEIQGDTEDAMNWFRKVLDHYRNVASWPIESVARTQFHLARLLSTSGDQDGHEAEATTLRDKATDILHRLLPAHYPEELHGIDDEYILFDHMLPVVPGGTRFTGKGLLECFMRRRS